MQVIVNQETGAVTVTISERNLESLVQHGVGGCVSRETAERRVTVVVESDAAHYGTPERQADQVAAIGRLTEQWESEGAREDARALGRAMARVIIGQIG